MTTKKSKKNINKKKIITIVVVILIAIISIFFILTNSTQKESIKFKTYYTGNIYSANYAANIIDHLNGDNILISPFNLNTYYASLYNISNDNTKKELNNYYNESLNNINKQTEKKLNNLKEKTKSNKHTELYEEYIKKYQDKKYDKLTIQEIKRLNNKEELIKLLIKIKLSSEEKLPVKDIKKYILTYEEKNYNEYQIKELIYNINNNYETYINKNTIKNINNFYYKNNYKLKENTIQKTKYQKTDNIVNSINKTIKESSNNNLKRLTKKIDTKSLVSINTLYMNYKWQEPFKEFKNQEFLNQDKTITIVEIMYSKENSYYENDHAIAIRKNFENNKYAFYAIIPKEKGPFALSTLDIDGLLNNETKTTVKIGIPSFNYQYEYDISKTNYKVRNIYTPNANLKKLSDDNLYVSSSIQKLYLNIGYKGTINSEYHREVTQEIEETKKEIILNRPFAFLIKSIESNDIIFIGKITIL